MLINAATWMNLANMLSERGQTQRITCCFIPFICHVQNRKISVGRKQMSDCLDLGKKEGREC